MKIKIAIMLLVSGMVGCVVTKNIKPLHPFVGDSIGCGNFIVHKLSQDNDQYISVKLDASAIEWKESQVYSISQATILTVHLRKFDGAVNHLLCNDLRPTQQPSKISEEVAKEGTVEVIISPEEMEKARNSLGYRVTVVLKYVIFDNLEIDYLRIDNIYVGWLPG